MPADKDSRDKRYILRSSREPYSENGPEYAEFRQRRAPPPSAPREHEVMKAFASAPREHEVMEVFEERDDPPLRRLKKPSDFAHGESDSGNSMGAATEVVDRLVLLWTTVKPL